MSRPKAFLALVLLVPAPSIGTLSAMVMFPNAWPGVLLFGLCKLWLLGLPLVWHRFVERAPYSFSPLGNGGLRAGLVSGLGISGIILAVYFAFGQMLVDRDFLVERLTSIGLASQGTFLVAAAYWILINSLLEEYVWRWFCVKQLERLLSPIMAILGSALLFTLHHIVAMRVYLGWTAVLVCASGIFLGGAIWSAMYVRYRSIWPGYLSHAIVDLSVFGIAAYILF